MTETALLVMAYGSPETLDDVERYYRHIRRGRDPEPDALDDLLRRYRAIGGASPLPRITQEQAEGVARRLDGVRAYVGFKHAAPFIEDAVGAIAADAADTAVGLVMAPHYSAMSVGDYRRRALQAARAEGWGGKLQMVESWHLEPGYIKLLARFVHDALGELPEDRRADAVVVFTAHSLPAGIVSRGDPYADQLADTAEAVAKEASLTEWRVAFQSASETGQPWLGPDVLEVLVDIATAGRRAVVVCPCGFVADHLEVLYDVDVECADLARDLGLAFARTRSPNADPAFLDVLAGVVARHLA